MCQKMCDFKHSLHPFEIHFNIKEIELNCTTPIISRYFVC